MATGLDGTDLLDRMLTAKDSLRRRTEGLPKPLFRGIPAAYFDKEDLLRMLQVMLEREQRVFGTTREDAAE